MPKKSIFDKLPELNNIPQKDPLINVEYLKGQSANLGNLIYYALSHKSFIYYRESDRAVAFTPEAIIEVGTQLTKDIYDVASNFVEEHKKNDKASGISMNTVADTLVMLEMLHASYFFGDEFEELQKDYFTYLREHIDNADDKTKEDINNGIKAFFEASRKNISRGMQKYNNLQFGVNINENVTTLKDEYKKGLRFDNEAEMEYLRNVFVSDMLKANIVDYLFMYENGIISGMDLDSIDYLRQLEVLSNDELENAFYVSGVFESREEIIEHYLGKGNDKKFALSFMNPNEALDLLIQNKITSREASRVITIENIKNFTTEEFKNLFSFQRFSKEMDFIETKNDRFTGKQDRFISEKLLSKINGDVLTDLVLSDLGPYKIGYESKDYIYMYFKLGLDNIKRLKDGNCIEVKDLIQLNSLESLKVITDKENKNIKDYLTEVYDIDNLEKLLNDDLINERFVQEYNRFLEELPKEDRQKYFKALSRQLEGKEKPDELLLSLMNAGLNFTNEDKVFYINEDIITDNYMDDKIDDELIISLVNRGFVTKEYYKTVFRDEEILDKFEEGLLGKEVLNLLDDREAVITLEFEDGKLSLKDVLELYSDKDGIDIDELELVLEDAKLENESLSDYLLDDIPEKKVEELFKKFLISHDELSNLVTRGIIDQDKANRYAESLSSHENFETLFNDYSSAILTEDTPRGESREHTGEGVKNPRASQIKNDPDLQKELFDRLGFDTREIALVGYNNSLDGYTLRASEEYGAMVFYRFDKPGNATYIMSLSQGMFFLNRMRRQRQNEEVEVLESNATKQEIRETEHVKVRNASKNLGKNIVDSMKALSTKFREEYRRNDDYKSEIDLLNALIKQDYEERLNDIR